MRLCEGFAQGKLRSLFTDAVAMASVSVRELSALSIYDASVFIFISSYFRKTVGCKSFVFTTSSSSRTYLLHKIAPDNHLQNTGI